MIAKLGNMISTPSKGYEGGTWHITRIAKQFSDICLTTCEVAMTYETDPHPRFMKEASLRNWNPRAKIVWSVSQMSIGLPSYLRFPSAFSRIECKSRSNCSTRYATTSGSATRPSSSSSTRRISSRRRSSDLHSPFVFRSMRVRARMRTF